MRIGIDAAPLVGVKTGIGNWTYGILRELSRSLPNLEVIGYLPKGRTAEFPKSLNSCSVHSSKSYPIQSSYLWLKWRAEKLVLEDDIDVFWAPRTLYPSGLDGHVPVVSCIHDLNVVLYPTTMPIVTMLAHKLWFRRDLLHATCIVSNSLGTSQRLFELIGRRADAIVPPGVDSRFVPQPLAEIEKLRQRYGLQEPYLIFVGTLEPRKNLAELLAAFERFNVIRREPLKLVIVGQRGWGDRGLFRRLDAGIANVKELGFVPEKDLPGLYAGSEALIMPSLYEGFGMPAAEAIACGTRVVATNIPELHEAAGPNAIYVEPVAESIFEGIHAALNQPRPVPVPGVSWSKSAFALAETLRNAASSFKAM